MRETVSYRRRQFVRKPRERRRGEWGKRVLSNRAAVRVDFLGPVYGILSCGDDRRKRLRDSPRILTRSLTRRRRRRSLPNAALPNRISSAMVVPRCVQGQVEACTCQAPGWAFLPWALQHGWRTGCRSSLVKRLYRAAKSSTRAQPDQHVVELQPHVDIPMAHATGRRHAARLNFSRANVHPTASWLIGDGARSSASSKPRPSTVKVS